MVSSYKARIMLVLSVLFVSFLPLSYAWWEIPHMVTAEVAKLHLSDDTRMKVEQIVATFAEYDRKTSDTIAASAVWGDLIKAHDLNAFDDWHFIDQPYITDPSVKPPPPNSVDSVWALQNADRVLRSDRSGPFGRAFMLRMLLHIGGDLHQPLHAVSRMSKQYPDGDLGGNKFAIKSALGGGDIRNLHSFWDAGAGSFEQPAGMSREGLYEKEGLLFIKKLATDIRTEFPTTSFLQDQLSNLNFTHWAEEAYDVAVKEVYTAWTQTNESWSTPRDVPAEYVSRAAYMCRRQVALGGYRLAAEMTDIFSKITPSPSPESQLPHEQVTWTAAATWLLLLVMALALSIVFLVMKLVKQHNVIQEAKLYTGQHDESGHSRLIARSHHADSGGDTRRDSDAVEMQVV